jgi:hypothetical protein
VSQELDIEKDPFLTLLTDALRAGPGTPQWHEAVAKLNTSDKQVDEYRLLIEARETLESGRDYRSVRAGPGFTRNLLTSLENEKQPVRRTRRISTPTLIALICGLVILAVIGLLVSQLIPRGPVNPVNPQKAIDDLAGTYFPNDILSVSFADGIPMSWRMIGSLPVQTSDAGLRAASADVPPDGYIGGGVAASDPISADQAFSFQVNLHVAAPEKDLTPQVFVSNSSDFSPDRATGSQELVWWLQGREQKVVVNGNVERRAALNPRGQTVTVRIIMNRDLAIVEADGHRLWAGPHHLGSSPRYLGVRFIRTDGQKLGDIAFQSVRVSKP